jgi:RNA polymerase sigma factor (TIGR02999 family)
MARGAPVNVTELLVAWNGGDEAALDRLVPIVYAELQRLARRHLARESGEAPQTTALVHEAYLRLVDQRSVRWQSRAHFYAIAAQMMRRILIDHARARLSERRGGGAPHLPLDAAAEVSTERGEQLVALDEALGRLAEIDPRKSRVVEMRFFGGMSVEETAEALGISKVTVMRDWNTAKAWLQREVERAGGPSP